MKCPQCGEDVDHDPEDPTDQAHCDCNMFDWDGRGPCKCPCHRIEERVG